jgi:hypothetical protein
MSTDDDRVAELAGEGGVSLDPIEQAELDELRALLADPSVWEEPDPSLEERVVQAISAEAGLSGESPIVVPLRRQSRRPWYIAAAGVAAAAAIALVAAITLRDTGTSGMQFDMALAATDLSPGASGKATLTRFDAGWRVDVDASGLPRLDNGQFYEAWLKKGDVLVPIGTFNEGGETVTMWAGVSPQDFNTLTVTIEQADGNQASSGQRVLVGTITS